MTISEFKSKFHRVAGPVYRGAAYPAFDPAAINESRIEDECRAKWYEFDLNPLAQIINIKWETQEECTEHSQLLEEIKRCFTYLKFKGYIKVKIFDRDGYDEFLETIDCTGGLNPTNNYVKHITFARASKMPKYMQLLREMVKLSKKKTGADRAWYVKKVWGVDLGKKSRGWNAGPFTLLRQAGYAGFRRDPEDGAIIWYATVSGVEFFNKMIAKA